MAEYVTPGVFVEKSSVQAPSQGVSSTVAGFVGVTQRGVKDSPVFIRSWSEYVRNFALGMDTPFIAESDLAFALYGFFQNGGAEAYIVRACADASISATVTPVNNPSFTAKEEGAWGNNLSVESVAGSVAGTFTVKVYMKNTVVEVFTDLAPSSSGTKYYLTSINGVSEYVTVGATGVLTAFAKTPLATGSDGTIADADYSRALETLASVDFNLLAVPSQSSTAMRTIIMDFAKRAGVFAVLDMPKTSTPLDLKTELSTLDEMSCTSYYPWLKVPNPMSPNSALRDCPNCGHILGTYVRIINKRGVWKAPAGNEAYLVGVSALYASVDTVATINARLNPLVVKKGIGITIWGAKTFSKDTRFAYVNNTLLAIYIENYLSVNTEWSVFEGSKPSTWKRLVSDSEGFLDTLHKAEALKGAEPTEAYYVVCDSTNNVEGSNSIGIDIGYAGYKPSEFIVIRIAHNTNM